MDRHMIAWSDWTGILWNYLAWHCQIKSTFKQCQILRKFFKTLFIESRSRLLFNIQRPNGSPLSKYLATAARKNLRLRGRNLKQKHVLGSRVVISKSQLEHLEQEHQSPNLSPFVFGTGWWCSYSFFPTDKALISFVFLPAASEHNTRLILMAGKKWCWQYRGLRPGLTNAAGAEFRID